MKTRHAFAKRLLLAVLTTGVVAVNAAALPDPAQAPAAGISAKPALEEIVVYGRGERLIGQAATASEGAVGGADLSVRPLLRVAELLEAVPGLIAAQHSGSGKANQYFLRGFNLDHGTDFTTYVDGVPWNLRSHGHGQGYLDLNGLIPDTVERIEYRKGTYRADVGDFSMAGAAFVSTIEQIDRPFVAAETGDHGWQRLAAGGTRKAGAGLLTLVGQLKGYDGPWQSPEDLQHVSLWGKYARPASFGSLKLTLSGYHATWNPTEQIPERAIGTPACADEFCALDPSATGETLRLIGSAQLLSDKWQASAYAQLYDWDMYSNPTYDYQIHQFDKRHTVGGRLQRTLIDAASLMLNVGTEARYDDIGRVGVDHTEQRAFIEGLGDNSIVESSAAVYAESTWTPVSGLRLFGGLRGDYYDFDVQANSPASYAGHESDSAASPKIGIAYALNDRVELYGNWGKGFHSNDARGVVNADASVPGLASGTGYEVGGRFEYGALKISATYWWLNLDSELKFVGDSNSVEPSSGSERRGYELTSFWRPFSWLAIDAVYTGSDARSVDNPEGHYIEGSVAHAGELGLSAIRGAWESSMRVRYLGEYPLLPDNSRRSEAETVINVRLAWRAAHLTVYGEVINLLDKDGKDIVYFYESNVAGLDPAGVPVAGRMSRAEEPRTVRVGVKYSF